MEPICTWCWLRTWWPCCHQSREVPHRRRIASEREIAAQAPRRWNTCEMQRARRGQVSKRMHMKSNWWKQSSKTVVTFREVENSKSLEDVQNVERTRSAGDAANYDVFLRGFVTLNSKSTRYCQLEGIHSHWGSLGSRVGTARGTIARGDGSVQRGFMKGYDRRVNFDTHP